MTSLDDESVPTLVDAGELLTEKFEHNGSVQQQNSLRKVPITIVTEFGDTADIEKSLTVAQDGQEVEEWINLANGCICCSIKDQGVNALESLMERNGSFDYILLETTGLADPGNIAPMFWVDEGLGSSIYLDGVVTVVDAKNILTSLDEPVKEELPTGEEEHSHAGPLMSTAHLQISHADVIILNKTDLVTSEQLQAVEGRLRSINALARIFTTQHSKIPGTELRGTLLDLNAYTTFTDPVCSFSLKGHSHLDSTISTVSLTLPAFDEQKLYTLENFLRGLLWEQNMGEKGYEIHRTKGRILMTNGHVKVVQGVREIFEIEDAMNEENTEGDLRGSKLVFIGRGLDRITGFGDIGKVS